jgi:hypothetical protein
MLQLVCKMISSFRVNSVDKNKILICSLQSEWLVFRYCYKYLIICVLVASSDYTTLLFQKRST